MRHPSLECECTYSQGPVPIVLPIVRFNRRRGCAYEVGSCGLCLATDTTRTTTTPSNIPGHQPPVCTTAWDPRWYPLSMFSTTATCSTPSLIPYSVHSLTLPLRLPWALQPPGLSKAPTNLPRPLPRTPRRSHLPATPPAREERRSKAAKSGVSKPWHHPIWRIHLP
jgi:hypothetical protein